MPFAKKFRFTMRLPDAGDDIDGFTVESCTVEHAPSGYGRYEYPVEIVLKGKGGRQAVRNALKHLLTPVKSTFSGYGNAYQLRFGKMEVESLGDRRYRVHGVGLGARVFLKKELLRFCEFLTDNAYLSPPASNTKQNIIDKYLEEYQVDARRKFPGRET